MLTHYFEVAMSKAQYKLLEDGNYWGEIPGFQGIWGYAERLEVCRDELRSALEDWVLAGLWFHDPLPVVDGIELTVKQTEDDATIVEGAGV